MAFFSGEGKVELQDCQTGHRVTHSRRSTYCATDGEIDPHSEGTPRETHRLHCGTSGCPLHHSPLEGNKYWQFRVRPDEALLRSRLHHHSSWNNSRRPDISARSPPIERYHELLPIRRPRRRTPSVWKSHPRST